MSGEALEVMGTWLMAIGGEQSTGGRQSTDGKVHRTFWK